MFWIVDIIIVLIIGLCTYIGYRKGLIGVAFKITSFLIALIITGILFYPISQFVIQNTQIDETIQKSIQDNFISKTEQEGQEDTQNPSKIITDYIEEEANEGINVVALSLSQTIVRIGVAIVLFVVVRIILILFKKFAEIIGELPIVKQFNKSGGIIYGALKGLFIVYFILAILSLIAPMISGTAFFEQIKQSYIGSFMYNYNILLMLIF